jgi:serine phosphatase RsbU (regulator of sigma subunit)
MIIRYRHLFAGLSPIITPYLAATALVIAGTWGLYELHAWLERIEGATLRPFTIGFLVPLGIVAALYGRYPALYALALSLALSAYALMPSTGLVVDRVSDVTGLVFLAITGCMLIYTVEVAHVNRELTRQAEARADIEEHLRLREQNIATTLQTALQPVLPSDVPGLSLGYFYKAALEEATIGGDFYDAFTLSGTTTAIIIGDVSGKGLHAAAQIATVRNMLRFALYGGRPMAQTVTELNAILTRRDLLSGFVTAFIGVYDAESGTLTYISCGHEPPIVCRAGGDVEQLPPTGMPLGVCEEAVYTEQDVAISAGDTVLLYTDGLSESGPTRSEMLSSEGIVRMLCDPEVAAARGGVEAMIDQLIVRADAHARGVWNDDVCIVAARVTKGVKTRRKHVDEIEEHSDDKVRLSYV